MMNGQRVTDILFRVNALECRDNVEDGIYFGPSKGSKTNYVKVNPLFRNTLKTKTLDLPI